MTTFQDYVAAAQTSCSFPRRQGLCSTCAGAGRYRCPACAAVSCSAACVTAHKKGASCTGKRDRTAFVDIRVRQTLALVVYLAGARIPVQVPHESTSILKL